MNIYFACSITGGRDFESVYQAIVHALVEDKHEVPTAHLAETCVTSVEAVIDPMNWVCIAYFNIFFLLFPLENH